MGNISNYTKDVKNALNLFGQVSALNSQLSELLDKLPSAMEKTSDVPKLLNANMDRSEMMPALEEASELIKMHKAMCDECATAYMKTAVGLKDVYKLLQPIAELEIMVEKQKGENNGGDNS